MEAGAHHRHHPGTEESARRSHSSVRGASMQSDGGGANRKGSGGSSVVAGGIADESAPKKKRSRPPKEPGAEQRLNKCGKRGLKRSCDDKPTAADDNGALEQTKEELKTELSQENVLSLLKCRANEADQLRKRIEQLVEESECPVCLERLADHVLSPCGHCYCCDEGCPSSQLSVCPMCSVKVESRIRVHGALQSLAEMLAAGDLLVKFNCVSSVELDSRETTSVDVAREMGELDELIRGNVDRGGGKLEQSCSADRSCRSASLDPKLQSRLQMVRSDIELAMTSCEAMRQGLAMQEQAHEGQRRALTDMAAGLEQQLCAAELKQASLVEEIDERKSKQQKQKQQASDDLVQAQRLRATADKWREEAQTQQRKREGLERVVAELVSVEGTQRGKKHADEPSRVATRHSTPLVQLGEMWRRKEGEWCEMEARLTGKVEKRDRKLAAKKRKIEELEAALGRLEHENGVLKRGLLSCEDDLKAAQASVEQL